MSTTVTTDVKVKPKGAGASGPGPDDGGGPRGRGPEDPKEWPPGWSRKDALEPRKYRIGMWVGLASIVMLFASLTSAYVIRQIQGLGDEVSDWVRIDIPAALWFNTAVILISSLTLEFARRALKLERYARFKRLISVTTLLGVVFLIGQVIAWRQLVAQGIYVNSNPHSSFFYLLTSLHGLHLLGGVIALGYVTAAAMRLRISMKKRTMVDITALYWHFMDGLWVYLFVLLFFVK